jgi:predicted enzyme related to lactoylglutathione lyase
MQTNQAHGQLAHFSINADDIDRAAKFYSGVFGWEFVPYGPPGFFMIQFPSELAAPVQGSLQGRRELVAGVVANSFECTLAVADIQVAAKSIEELGGKIIMPKTTLPGIGHLVFFQDPEGNMAGAMQYDPEAQ